VLVDQGAAERTRAEVRDLLVRAEGPSRSSLGRVWFAASPLSPPFEHFSVLTFVPAAAPPGQAAGLGHAVAVLTTLLIGMAVALAYAFMRGIRDDVDFVRRRISEMAEARLLEDDGVTPADPPMRQPVPIRSLDQVGLLTAALNVLITRFEAAERTFRADVRQAAELDRERPLFLAGLSHELRTPLNAILGFTHVLESEADGPLSADAKEALAQVRTSGEHLRTLIDDILDLSAAETGQLRLSHTWLDVYALAEDVVREAMATVGDRPISIALRGEPGTRLFGDPRRLRQVLTNLVSNALKFTVEGEVDVSVQADPNGVSIAVADTGRGIAPELIGNVFEAYRQADDPGTRRRGTGLGLAITRRLVQLHGGTIRASSRPAEGSTFTIHLPAARRADSSGPPPADDRPSDAPEEP